MRCSARAGVARTTRAARGQHAQAPPTLAHAAAALSHLPALKPSLQWFASIDTDRSGHLDARELQRALAMGNLNFNLSDVRSHASALCDTVCAHADTHVTRTAAAAASRQLRGAAARAMLRNLRTVRGDAAGCRREPAPTGPPPPHPPQVDQMVRAFDQNASRSLNFEEFQR